MGNSSTKRSNKQESAQKNEVKKEFIASQIKQVEKIEQSYIQTLQQNPAMLQTVSIQDVKDTLTITDTVKTQIARGGKPLSKIDLITIILSLDSTNKYSVVELKRLTVSDLITMIRTIIYGNAIQSVLISNNEYQQVYKEDEHNNVSVSIEEITKNNDSSLTVLPLSNSKQLVMTKGNTDRDIRQQISNNQTFNNQLVKKEKYSNEIVQSNITYNQPRNISKLLRG